MLTEALRSFVMRVAAESDAKTGNHSVNNVLLHEFRDRRRAARHRAQPGHSRRHAGMRSMDARADKLVRDAVIWTHLAGDSVQRMKAVRRMKWN